MSRATFLLKSDMYALEVWASEIRRVFHDETTYLVGSALTTTRPRDVDLRLILPDERVAALSTIVELPGFDQAFSLWAQAATGLPIDFQVQSMTEANALTDQTRRHPLGMSGDGRYAKRLQERRA